MRCKRAIAIPALFVLLAASPIFAQQTGDAERPTVGTNMDRRAGKFIERGNYTEAERIYNMALNRKERALGPDNREVAVTLNGLAMLHQQQEQYAQAEDYHVQALEIRVRALGLDHPEVAETLENMTALYQAQGLDAKVAGLPARAQEIFDNPVPTPGPTAKPGLRPTPKPRPRTTITLEPMPKEPDPPEVEAPAPDSWDAITVELMAKVARHDYVRSVDDAERAVSAAELEFGEVHPNTARSLNNLAYLYYHERNRRYTESEGLYVRALDIWENTPEPDYGDKALTMDNLARLYKRMKRFELVDALNRRTMAVRELVPEADRPDFTKQAVINEHTRMLGEAEAEPFNINVRQGIINGKGMESVEAAFAMHINARTKFAVVGQFAYAEQLYTMALDARRKVYPAPSFRAGETLLYLANLYISQGEYERPKRLLEEATELMEASLKRGDSQYSLLAQLYIAQQKLFDTHEQHENHQELAFKIQLVMTGSQPSIEVQESIIEGHRGREYPDATQVLSELAMSDVSNHKYAHALPIFKNLLKLMDETHPLYAPTLKNFADLYAATGQPDLADPLYERAKDAAAYAAANPPVVDTTPKASQDSIDLADDLLKEMEDQ